MTVKELIKELQTYDKEHHVVIDVVCQEFRTNKEIDNLYFNGFCCIQTKED